MAQKHLHELLEEDQEPFQLKHFIANRRSQLKKLDDKIVKKQKSISSNTTSLCKHACFFSVRDQSSSPYPEKLSPINFHFHYYHSSEPRRRSPVRRMNSLHIPAKTSSLLLEAATRIQQRQNHQPKPKKTQMRFGLFGSILKKIMSKKNNITTTNGITTRREQTTITTTGTEPRRSRQSSSTGCSEKHMMKTDKETTGTIESTSRRQFSSTTGCSEKRTIDDETCSCNHSRLSSSGWSETNETSSSCCRSDTEENELDNAVIINGDFGSCESPLSPFRFSLQKCPSSSGCRTPEFTSSPAASPVCHKKEDEENYDGLANTEQEEDEKEQCSPVSVLDPPFDDDDGHEICEYEYEDENEEDDDDCCNYALVQRAQQQLLYKLRRFEKLAELDPIELEKLMLDEEDEGIDDLVDDIDDDSMLSYKDRDFETFASEVTIPFDMKRLVSDLISEEKTETKTSSNGEEEVVFGRVCKRLDSWQHVRSDTIDMMIESDLKNEVDAWKKFQEQREETALEVEVSIFRLLVEELAEEIVYFDGHYGISNEVLA